MSSLSSLLNPAPSSTETAPSKAQQLAPLQLDGQDHRSRPYQPGFSNAQSPIHHTVTSPGLDVLAAAASSTAPLISPTQQQSSMGQAILQSPAQNSLRSESSGGMLPGTPAILNPSQEPHASGLQQRPYLGTGCEQHMPDYKEESSKALAPLHQSLPIQHHGPAMMGNAFSLHSGQPDDTRAGSSAYAAVHNQDQSTTTQMREPPISDLPSPSADSVPNQAEQVQVKAELRESPDVEMKNGSPLLINSFATVQHDHTPGTPLKNVMSNASPDPTSQTEDSSANPPKPKSGPPKKRPAPRKGTGIKPPAKKRKVETGSGKASPRTGTPATSRASGTPAPKKGKQESATPTRSSSVVNPEDDEDDGEPELFCICRKPDDHTVMIGCDGPCEDWFHTRCVNMTNEKVALISKWYCMLYHDFDHM